MADQLPACRVIVLSEINAHRVVAHLEPLEGHPVLEAIARERAREIALGGPVDPSMARLRATTRRLYRDGYDPHDWTESALVGRWGSEVFGQWAEVHPRWYEEVRTGDYEHVGVGIERLGNQPVFAIVFGLTKRTMEWRLAAPLADLGQVRTELLLAVNSERRKKGRGPLVSNPNLDSAAQAHAEDMLRRAYYDHKSPEGATVARRVRDAGYGKPRMVTENIAKGLFSPTETVERWMASSGHRKNILIEKASELGSGVAFGENANGFEVVWVQVLATPSSGAGINERQLGN